MSRVGDLMVKAENSNGEYEELPPTSARFRLVEALVHLGLSVLETAQGRQSLAAVGKAVIEANEEKRKKNRRFAGHIYWGKMSDMPLWVDRFLAALRNDFPCVYISPECEGEAFTKRYNWGTDMANYPAGEAADVVVSKVIIENMLFARQQDPRVAGDAYDMFKFQMGISIAHEIVHLFVGFLTGTERAMTPPDIRMPGFHEDEESGEAGRYWEKIFLGGAVENWSSKNHPLKERQAGTPFIFPDAFATSPGSPVSKAYIDEFLNGLFSFPVRPSSQARPVLRRNIPGKETTKLREARSMRNVAGVSSPPRDVSSGVVYRRLPPSTPQGYVGSVQKYSTYGRR